MRFGVLGPVRAERDGSPLEISGARQRTLLALLLASPNRPVSGEALLDALWSDPPGTARQQLQNAVWSLRRALAEPDRITTTASGYVLHVARDELDAERFEGGLAAAAAEPDPVARAELLARALDEWAGEAAYDGLDVAPLWTEARRLGERRLQALEERLGLELDDGRTGEVLPEVAALAAAHPRRERFAELHVLALYRAGRQADALAAYAEVRRRLVDELGLEPGPALQQLHQAVLTNDASIAEAASTRRTRVPAELPADLRTVVGRDAEMTRLGELTASGGAAPAVVVVSGPPGVGKSSLTIHWAHRNRERFPDGQVFLHLGRAGQEPMSTEAALSHVVRSFGYAGELPEPIDELAALYRSLTADRAFLLVLDNASAIDQVLPLLPGAAADSAVLISSRHRLAALTARIGARLLDLDTLSSESSLELLHGLVGIGRCEQEPAAAEELAVLCGRLPLALGIAGASLASRPEESLAEYVDRLGADVLTTLAIEGDVHVTRTFHDSYAALDATAQRLFRMLGLLPGATFSARAAAAALDEPLAATRRVLDTLVARSLVRPVGGGRFTVHDLLKRYAEYLAGQRPDEHAATVERYLAWLTDALTCASDRLYWIPMRLPSMPDHPIAAEWICDESAALQWLDDEVSALREAVVLAGGIGRPETAAAFAIALPMRFWQGRHPGAWVEVVRAALRVVVEADHRRATAAVRRSLGVYHLSRIELDQAGREFSRALALCREVGWSEPEAVVLNNLGVVALIGGDPRGAYDQLRLALRVDESGILTLINLSAASFELGKLREAVDYAERGLERSQRQGLKRNLGNARRQLGEFDAATRVLQAALAGCRAEDDKRGETATIEIQARLSLDQGELRTAEELAHQTRMLARLHGFRDLEPRADLTLGEVALGDGALDEASRLFAGALDVASEIGLTGTAIEATLGLAATALAIDERPLARERADAALRAATAADYGLHVGRAHLCLARIAAAGGDADQARRHASDALSVFGDSEHPMVAEARELSGV